MRAHGLALGLVLGLALGLAPAAGCSFAVHGQAVPQHRRAPAADAFTAPDGVAVLHYYGSGGWGIAWRGTYIATAPYFSNHDMLSMNGLYVAPKEEVVAAGVAGTPWPRAAALLVGHGHIDHAGDLPALIELVQAPPVLIANTSTVNMLAPLRSRFGCVAALGEADAGQPLQRCPIPNVRITPLPSEHAPHFRLGPLQLAAYTGNVTTPRQHLPRRGPDFVGGSTWAFSIDLLDAQGQVAFRIHYMDAAASPPYAFVPPQLLAERDVDVHIACVAGYGEVYGYPEAVLRQTKARFVLAGHWESFFRPLSWPLWPVPLVLNPELVDTFMQRVESVLGTAPRGVSVARRPGCDAEASCGPAAATWLMPVPGETVHFATGAALAAAAP